MHVSNQISEFHSFLPSVLGSPYGIAPLQELPPEGAMVSISATLVEVEQVAQTWPGAAA